MAEIIKRGKFWYFRYVDHDGRRHMKRGCPDRKATEQMTAAAVTEDAKIRNGMINARDLAYSTHEGTPLAEHLEAWRLYLLGKGASKRHANEGYARVVKLMSLAKATHLSDLTLTRMQAALASLRDWRVGCRCEPSIITPTGEKLLEVGMAQWPNSRRSAGALAAAG